VTAHSDGSIRHARLGDADAIAALLGELGYRTEVDCARARLERLLSKGAGVLVYERGGAVVALAAYQIIDLLERSRPQCRITALVVRSEERRRGTARALIEAIESQALRQGCFRLEVTTQPDRSEAAAFYDALGFEERPRRLVKPLADGRVVV
jgi:GNAT superfamily N-acetyltransferase